MRKITLIILTLFCISLFTTCKKDDSPSEPDQVVESINQGSVENSNVHPFEFVSITKTSSIILKESYNATFGGKVVQLNRVTDSTLVFVIPEIESGKYDLTLDLGSLQFNVTKTTVANEEALISNVFTTFDDQIEALSIPAPNELETSTSFKNEVMTLYNSLSTVQKEEVALFYQANKDIFKAFKENVSTIYDAPTTLVRKGNQSECPKTDFKEFYSCTAKNLASSSVQLGASLKEMAEIIAYATALGLLSKSILVLGPAAVGLVAVGTTLVIVTAIYVLITEVIPAVTGLFSKLSEFLYSNWVLTKATFLVLTAEFSSGIENALNIDARFRAIRSTDAEVSPETSLFLNSYNQLQSAWGDFAKLMGEIPSFEDTEESVELETEDITISNISNSNVQLVSQNGENVKFKSLSDNEESFSFDITVNKEGFTQSETVNAIVKEVAFNYQGTWINRFYLESDGSLYQDDRIIFDANGESPSREYNIFRRNEGWMVEDSPSKMTYSDGRLVLDYISYGISWSFIVDSVDANIFHGESTQAGIRFELHRQ
ncbi:MAG: hypothetical protein COA50_16300 [Flavobacteriaceae bacterium]|nr:MAG: hypothetical protein COA50_16300 [Flavobacteriaceae bacterium]